MNLISLVLTLAIVGLILYLIETYIPMADPIKLIIRIVIVVAVILWLLNGFGVLGGGDLHLGKLG